MKKFLIAIACVIMATLTLFSVACGKNKFTYTDMTDWGAIKTETLGGFAFETDNYVYFINGEAKNTDDNKFGKPIKGSLVAVSKSELGKENAKYSIVVPKLFAATDKFSGLFVAGEGENAYVYYGSPCTDKDSSGSAASSRMTFMRTSLDGKNTDTYLTIASLSYEYRFFEVDGKVYILYYDEENTQIVCYNTADKSEVVVAKTDAETTTPYTINGATYYPSLSSYKLATTSNGLSLVYTIDLYSENYYEDKASKEGYTRKTAKFNLLVAYTVGDAKIDGLDFYGKLVIAPETAKADNCNYAVEQIQKGATEEFVFITKTDIHSKATSYGASKANFVEKKWEEVKELTKVSTTSILVDLENIYAVDTEKQIIYKTTLIGDAFTEEQKIATATEANQLLFIDGDYIYYYTSGNNLACYDMKSDEANKKQIKVSEDIVATSWYAPEVVKVDGKTFVLYLDNSSEGASYIKCIDVTDKSDANIGVDDDEDGEYEAYEFSGHVVMGIRLDKDIANDAIVAINKIETGEITFTEGDNGELYSEKLNAAISAYDKLTKEQKKFVEEDVLVKIDEAKQVVKLANLYNKLKGVEKYAEMTDDQKAEFKARIEKDYKEAKAFRQELLNSKKFDYITTRDRLNNNLKYYYQEADKIFAE